MADYPSRASLLGADPGAVAIRNLLAETESLPKAELPSFWEWAKDHPGFLSSKTKDPHQYDQDVRRAHLVRRASEAGLMPDIPEEAIRQLRSPYEPYGPDSPLSNAGRWFSSFPGAVYAGSQMLANAVDPKGNPYPSAYDDFAKNVNNFVAFAEPMGVNKNHMRDMSDMRDEITRVPWRQPEVNKEAVMERYRHKADPKTGRELLNEAHVNDVIGDTGTKIWGGALDATVDPFFSRAKTVPHFLVDYGLGSMHETLPLLEEAKEYYRPSDAVYY